MRAAGRVKPSVGARGLTPSPLVADTVPLRRNLDYAFGGSVRWRRLIRMNTIDLEEPEREALRALKQAAATYPEADGFEHDRSVVVMPGARHDIRLPISREMLRRFGHLGLVEFTHERDAVGRGRWTFVLSPRADDFV